MPEEPVNIKKRPRLKEPRFDEPMVKGLLQEDAAARDNWLVTALKSRSRQALASVEEALARLSGKPDLEFLQPDGDIELSSAREKAAGDKIIELAVNGQLLQDPVFTQALMPFIIYNENNSRLMQNLARVSPAALQIYQLLGIQMQLSILTGVASKKTGK